MNCLIKNERVKIGIINIVNQKLFNHNLLKKDVKLIPNAVLGTENTIYVKENQIRQQDVLHQNHSILQTPIKQVEKKLNLSLISPSSGVLREEEDEDIRLLVENFTAPALARALRERESKLQTGAELAHAGNYKDLLVLLTPFKKESIEKRRIRRHGIDVKAPLTRKEIVIIQRYLHRMPRQVFNAAHRRASVVIPICNVSGIPSILFEKRSTKVRTHKQEVCFPGGMLEEGVDNTIIQTSLREMQEELGVPVDKVEVLGILRCNWNEVNSLTGISVTPVVGYLGELTEMVLLPNVDEVEDYFTVSLTDLLNEKNWSTVEYSSPVFTYQSHQIWGLTSYLLDKFLKDVLLKCIIRNIH